MNLKNHVCICKEGCLIAKIQSSFSVYGDKTNYQFQNPRHKIISKYIVDNCVLSILEEDEKCDYLFIIKNGEKEDGYFVELKGGKVLKAVTQLTNSINVLKNNISGKLYGRIVCSKFPKAPYTLSSKEYIKLKKAVNDNLIIKIGQISETV